MQIVQKLRRVGMWGLTVQQAMQDGSYHEVRISGAYKLRLKVEKPWCNFRHITPLPGRQRTHTRTAHQVPSERARLLARIISNLSSHSIFCFGRSCGWVHLHATVWVGLLEKILKEQCSTDAPGLVTVHFTFEVSLCKNGGSYDLFAGVHGGSCTFGLLLHVFRKG